MRRLVLSTRLLLLLAPFTLLATAPQASPVAWNFVVTACTVTGLGGPCTVPSAPIATLTLQDTTSSGSATWDGLINVPPVYSGDPFSFTWDTNYPTISPAFHPLGECSGLFSICFFDISWTEFNDVLTGVKMTVAGFHDDIGLEPPLGLTGGGVASDLDYSGCPNTQCRVTGFWTSQSTTRAPEPSTILMLLLPLAFVALRARGA